MTAISRAIVPVLTGRSKLSATAIVLMFSSPLLISLARADAVRTVSIIEVIANPDRFEGSDVRVSGYVRVGFEVSALCLSKDPPSMKECLWIEVDAGPFRDAEDLKRFDKVEAEWRRWNGHAATIQGVFTRKSGGYSHYAGVLQRPEVEGQPPM